MVAGFCDSFGLSEVGYLLYLLLVFLVTYGFGFHG
jgi:hypothetical protein